MKIHISKWRTPPFAVLTGTLSLMALMSVPAAHAESGYVGIWNGIYPGSSAANDAGCQLCHAGSTRELNPYGEALCSSGAGSISNRIQAVVSVNSDADPTGASNLTEINASTQPGWTPGNVNPTYNRGDCSVTGNTESPPFGNDPGFLMDPVAGNQPPQADANGPYNGTVNSPLTLDGSASSDPDGSIVAFDWDFGDGNTGTGASPTHTYLSDGTFTVRLTVTDDAGDTGTDNSIVTIGLGNQPPVADAKGPYNGRVGDTVTFDGTGSSDPDGSIVSYSWDFGDGTTDSGPSPSHNYNAEGTYHVTLEVMDDSGATDAAMTTATIAPVTTGADAFLTRLNVPGRVKGKMGRTSSQRITAFGGSDTTAQDATVSLTVRSPAGVAVAVNPASSSQLVSPERSARYTFRTGITCNAPGTYLLEWTASIAAAANSDPGNDTLRDTTSVSCSGQQRRVNAVESAHDDDEEENETD